MTAPTPPAPALVRPFTVSIPDSEIDDVKQRLARTRWPDPETVADWSQGGSGSERQISGRLLGARLRLAAL
jgi:epoxide hydrolase-like protein